MSKQLPLEEILACPRCHAGLLRKDDAFICSGVGCGFEGAVKEGIVEVMDADRATFFDRRFRVMMHGSDGPGARAAFYAQQVAEVERRLAGARVILDVGCGPKRVYERPPRSTIIGLDPSWKSLRYNQDVDLRLYGSAVALPLLARSVDAVVCFYSIHHFVGTTARENESLVRTAFTEFSRVLRGGGDLLVFEVVPWAAVWAAQRLGWNLVRHVLGGVAAMYFWHKDVLTRLGHECLPGGTTLEQLAFRIPWWVTFPPAFALPRLQLPRLFYPFDICMYHWRVREGAEPATR